MAYRLQARRDCDAEVRRVAGERLSKAVKVLSEDSADAAHEARKRLKEVRALLRLVHKPLGKKVFARHNQALRDLARVLAEERDAQALVEAWTALCSVAAPALQTLPLEAIRERLLARCLAPAAAPSREPLIEALREQQALSADWPLSGSAFALLKAGLQQSFGDGRRALKVAQQKGSDETLHEWRKRVKDHWYHTRLLRDAWPDLLKARRRSLERLSDLLGDDHDLALLQGLLAAEPALFGDAVQAEQLTAVLRERRAELQRQAFHLGRRIYAEKPEALAGLWADYWRIARS